MSEPSFPPELGQMVWSNTPWHQHEMQPMVESGLRLLGELVRPLMPEEYGRHSAPTENAAQVFENEVFVLRAYCWCDGELAGHEHGCPPNFVCGDFAACWYKYLGRGSSQSRTLTEAEWRQIMQRCLESLTTGG